MLKKMLIFLMTFGVISFCFITLHAAEPEFKWDMPNEYGVTSLSAETDNVFIKKVNELSGGRIKITYHPGASLGYKTKDHWDAVGDGAIPLASSFMASLRGIDPIFSMISLPFVAKSIDESRIMMEVAKPYFNKLLKENNQIILYTSPWPACGLWAKKPIVKSSDLKGLKIRVYDPSGTRTFNAAGASAIQLTWSDIVPQLSTGGINCILTSAEGGVFSKFWDFLDNYTELNYISPLMIIHMNADTFNDLPEDMKAAVLKAADFARDYGWTKVHARAEKNYAELRKHDVTVTKNIPQELLNHFVKSRQGAMDDWLKKMGPEGKKMLDDFYKRVNK